MPRPTFSRRVGFIPHTLYFKPAGVRMADLQEIILAKDEVEAMRLKDLLGLSQEEAAREMDVSQPTLHRLLVSAHQKIADAFINGKAVRIEGGNVHFAEDFTQPCRGRQRWGCRTSVAEVDALHQESGGKVMKIAVTSQDGLAQGMVDERFGRCRKILVYNVETKEYEVIDNTQNMNSAQGAGIQTAQNVVNSGVQAVISGHFGPKAFQVLRTAGIQTYTVSGAPVAEAIKKFELGELIKLDSADVQGHW